MAFPQLFSRTEMGTVQLSSGAARLLTQGCEAPQSTYQSDELFGDNKHITIAHQGQQYSLRITSHGKLLLTK